MCCRYVTAHDNSKLAPEQPGRDPDLRRGPFFCGWLPLMGQIDGTSIEFLKKLCVSNPHVPDSQLCG